MSIFSQKLTLNELSSLLNHSNWSQTNTYLKNKNFIYHSSDAEGVITWTYNYDKWGKTALAWIYATIENEKIAKIRYQISSSYFKSLSSELNANGYKQTSSEILKNSLQTKYTNQNTILKIREELSENGNHIYIFDVIKKGGIYDYDNGKKTEYKDGKKYEYTLKNGKINGIVKVYGDYGLESEFYFINDQRNGQYKSYYNNGKIEISGTLKNDKKTGLWTYYNEYGNIVSKENYLNGELNGATISYFDNGKIESSYTYRNGEKHGPAIEYYENGNIAVKYNLKNDDIDGLKTLYNKKGQLMAKVTYQEGIKNGPASYYNEDGKLDYTCNYVNNKIEGKLTFYHENGKPEVIFSMENDKKSGQAVRFTENGQKIGFETYLGDSLDGPFKRIIKGETIEGNYNYGKKSGEWKYYDKEGKIEQIVEYDNLGYSRSSIEYYPNGNMKKFFSDSKYIVYDSLENTVIYSEYLFDDLLEYREYTKNNQLKVLLKDWKKTWYNENGQKHFTVSTKKGSGISMTIPLFENYDFIGFVPMSFLHSSSYPANGDFITYDEQEREILNCKIDTIPNEDYKCLIRGQKFSYNNGKQIVEIYDNDTIDLTKVMKECSLDGLTIKKKIVASRPKINNTETTKQKAFAKEPITDKKWEHPLYETNNKKEYGINNIIFNNKKGEIIVNFIYRPSYEGRICISNTSYIDMGETQFEMSRANGISNCLDKKTDIVKSQIGKYIYFSIVFQANDFKGPFDLFIPSLNLQFKNIRKRQ